MNQINHQIICDCNHVHTLFFTVFLKYECPAFRWHADLCEILPHDLNEVRHGEVNDVVPPGQLQHHVRMQQVIGCKQAGSKALFPAFLQEPLKQIFRQLSILGLRSVQHGILGNAETHTLLDLSIQRNTVFIYKLNLDGILDTKEQHLHEE